MNTIQDPKTMQENSPILNQSIPRPLKLNNTNYRHNLESDYTEKIETLAKALIMPVIVSIYGETPNCQFCMELPSMSKLLTLKS
ncbi:hypothetical protein PCC7821_04992 (plasmid) [Planktothrix rubescens NIVA-CYA 18]|nr:hypothetical protein PCC7821_04992 [Planktothrix rubescens NIVA-CYA 18]